MGVLGEAAGGLGGRRSYRECLGDGDPPGRVGGGDGGVGPGWCGERGDAVVGDPHGPRGVVDDPVMVTAEQHKIRQGSRSEVCPEDDVMSLTPGRRDLTTWERAVLVPKDQRPAHPERDGPRRPPDVQRLTRGREDRGQDDRVARHSAELLDRDLGAGVQGRVGFRLSWA